MPEIEHLANGKYDSLFPDPADKPSLLYAEARKPHQLPRVFVSECAPVVATNATLPIYPPIAKAAHVEGKVVLEFDVAADGKVNSVSALSGPLMLQQSTVEAARQWLFPQQWDVPQPPHQYKDKVTVSYRMNCGQTAAP